MAVKTTKSVVEEHGDLEKSEAVVAVVTDSVPFKNTTVGKTVRTFLQAMAGVVSTISITLAASEDFRNFVEANTKYSWVLVVLPVATAFFTALQNGLDPNVPTI